LAQLRREAALRVGRERCAVSRELDLGLVGALARFREQGRLAESRKRVAHEQQRHEGERQSLLQAALVVGKDDHGDDADHAGRRQRKAAVAPELWTRHSEEEVAHGYTVKCRA